MKSLECVLWGPRLSKLLNSPFQSRRCSNNSNNSALGRDYLKTRFTRLFPASNVPINVDQTSASAPPDVLFFFHC